MRGMSLRFQHQPGRVALLAAVLLFSGLTWAGPSLPHLGEYPQGSPRHATEPTTESEAEDTEPAPPALCPASERDYRKSLLITAFPRRGEASANGGGLQGMERALPEWLANHLAGSGTTFHQQVLSASFPAGSPGETGQRARQLARDTQSQLILTGELLDLGMANPSDLLNPGLLTRGRNAAVSTFGLNEAWDSRQRHLVLQLTLLNGLTGHPVFRREYRLSGVWDPRHPDRAHFGTPAFWKTGYGENVEKLLAQAGAELAEAIRCQPLVARLERTAPGAPALLRAGAIQGLQTGDQLPLHRVSLRAIPGEYRQYRAQLMDSGARLTVLSVKPHSSRVRVEGHRTLYGEHLAVTPLRTSSEEAEERAPEGPEERPENGSMQLGQRPAL